MSTETLRPQPLRASQHSKGANRATEQGSPHLVFGLPRWLSGKESTCQCRRRGFDPWVGQTPWRRKWQPSQVFLPREFHRQRSVMGYSPWSCKELDMTEHILGLARTKAKIKDNMQVPVTT